MMKVVVKIDEKMSTQPEETFKMSSTVCFT